MMPLASEIIRANIDEERRRERQRIRAERREKIAVDVARRRLVKAVVHAAKKSGTPPGRLLLNVIVYVAGKEMRAEAARLDEAERTERMRAKAARMAARREAQRVRELPLEIKAPKLAAAHDKWKTKYDDIRRKEGANG